MTSDNSPPDGAKGVDLNVIITAVIDGLVESVATACAAELGEDVLETEARLYDAIAEACTMKAEMTRELIAKPSA